MSPERKPKTRAEQAREDVGAVAKRTGIKSLVSGLLAGSNPERAPGSIGGPVAPAPSPSEPLRQTNPSEKRTPSESAPDPSIKSSPKPVSGPESASPAKSGPGPESHIEPLRRGPDPESAPLPDSGGVRITKHYTRTVNAVYDDLFPTLAPAAQAVYSQLYRLSYGHQRRTCKISLPRLAERCNMGLTATRDGAKVLEKRGLVRRVEIDHDGAVRSDRGIVWLVSLPDSTPADSTGDSDSGPGSQSGRGPKSGPMKERKKRHEETPAAPAPAISVYDVRRKAAQIYEARHRDPAFHAAELREELRAELDGEGLDVADAILDEAVRGML